MPTQAPPDETGEPPVATTIVVRGVLYVGNDPSDGIAGATITIGARTTTTELDGTWELAVPAGTFTVSASAAGYRGAQITRSAVDDTWASFGLSLANSSTGNAGLQGVVYYGSSGSNRIPFAQVTLSMGQTVSADGNGYYKLGDLPPGPVTITASAPGYETASVSRTLTNSLTEWGSVRLAP